MNKININLLVPEGINGSSELNIITLFETKKSKKPDINIMIKNKKKEKKKTIQYYNDILQMCYKSITEAQKIGRYDIICKIPDIGINNINYSPNECMKYIEINIKKLKYDTYRIDKYNLFITWHKLMA